MERGKRLSIVIPCYNETENVVPMYHAVTEEMARSLPEYEYELVFVDNKSTDGTRDQLRLLCAGDPRVRAILNNRNYGQFNSPYHAMLQVSGDCVISLCCDFQDPVDMIPQFVREWEAGYQVVCGVKTASREGRLMRLTRTAYYRFLSKASDINAIEHFTGFGLYDRSFIEIMRTLDDPIPFLRGIVAEFSTSRREIPYEQAKRRSGKTHNNFSSLYDAAMLSFTSYTKIGLRLATYVGFVFSGLSVMAALAYLVMKLVWWERFPAGNIPILLAVLVLGSMQIFFVGILGEYILNITRRVIHRPLVIEEERLNFPPETPAGKPDRRDGGKAE
ncbi:MAG: glycosyltransferase family 2 protein [Clostridiales bacterium]|nr:glycosyltransferase family 2 protein [Clostridiales bacterium]